MNYLLDVNALIAWGWVDHVEHDRVASWLQDLIRKPGVTLLTSAIPELGFVRVSVQRTGGSLSVKEASAALRDMLGSLESQHRFLPDDLEVNHFPNWCQAASRTTDAHLIDLANRHEARLATLDAAIPGAFVIPIG